jgi:predicted ArsR family transcriptional regulator
VEKRSKPRKLHEPTRKRLERVFQALPPLNSSEYLEVLEKATAEDLPAPVLARAYRQLAPTTHSQAIERTLERLLDARDRYGYLKEIRLSQNGKLQKAIMNMTKTTC